MAWNNTSQSSEEVSEESDENSISPNEKSEVLPVERFISFTDSLAHLHSLEAHRDFIAEVLDIAQTRLIFCSPFINSKSGYQMDFTIEKLWGAVSRGVDVTFVVRKHTNYLWSFKKYLGNLLHQKNFHLVEKRNFHSKTVVVDEDVIAEGSFNWLSASRDEGSQYHNHEATFVYRGEAARPLIQDFLKKVDSE